MNIFKSTKNNIKNISLSVVNIVLTLTTLIYLFSIYGFEHLNKELVMNFIIGAGFSLFILTIIIVAITLILMIAFKMAASKILENIDTVNNYIQLNKTNKEKAQED